MPKYQPLPLKDIAITDPFWAGRIATARRVSIDYMWRALNDEIEGVPPSRCIANFRIACGLEEGEFYGFRFQDSDLYKWLEAVAYSLEVEPDPALLERAEAAIALVAGAQRENGYLNNHVTLRGLRPWSDLMTGHEMYCAGHLMEAAVAWKNATGQDSLLKVACRLADHIDQAFGPEADKKHGYPGHQEIELGLYKLYASTGEARYLNLARYLLDARGHQPFYYDQEEAERRERGEAPIRYFREHGPMPYSYQQAHLPVREQKEAIGHAVRVVYMLSGMADVGDACDATLLEAAETLYRNIVDTQMYITGGIGSMGDGEAFTFSYDLPNDRMYNETCASIGLMMACRRLGGIHGDGQYADTLEQALYNTVLAGVSLAGTEFFYVNPMEVWPRRSENRHDLRDVKALRQGWYGCACCPPNVLRTLLGLGGYIYAWGENRLNVDLYINSSVRLGLEGGAVTVRQSGDYLQSGRVELTVEGAGRFALALRLPGWCRGARLSLNGAPADLAGLTQKGYAVLDHAWQPGDRVILELPMPPRYLYCDDRVPFNAGRVALTRGPLVYCVEEQDNGAQLWNLLADPKAPVAEEALPQALGRAVGLSAAGWRRRVAGSPLYTETPPTFQPQTLRFVPYYAWGNRTPGEMAVWLFEAR